MRILVTGFEPFGGETINPSRETVLGLPDQLVARGGIATGSATEIRLHKAILPVSFTQSLAVVLPLIDAIKPDLVLALGEAGGRPDLTLERVAVNIQDAAIPDNDGYQPLDQAVIAGGPSAYFSTLPLKTMLQVLHHAGLPASLSLSAGTFVCNHVFYGLCHHASTRHPGLRCGFLHVPYLPQQATAHKGAPSLALDHMVQAVTLILAVAAESGMARDQNQPQTTEQG